MMILLIQFDVRVPFIESLTSDQVAQLDNSISTEDEHPFSEGENYYFSKGLSYHSSLKDNVQIVENLHLIPTPKYVSVRSKVVATHIIGRLQKQHILHCTFRI